MTCIFCNAPMTTDDGVLFYCVEGCRRCECCRVRKAEMDSDSCGPCDLEGLLYEAAMEARRVAA